MIYVVLGTQKQSFSRLLNYLDELDLNEVIIQRGYTPYDGKYKSFDFIENISSLYNKGDVVITHGGVGSIMEAIKKGCYVIAVGRLSENNEHVDDHQLEIINELCSKGFIKSANNQIELKERIENINNEELNLYVSNNKFFNANLIKIINEL